MNKKNKDITAIEYYNNFALEYDQLAREYHWQSPNILFGIMYDYIEPNKKILDVGIGTGLSAKPFKKHGLKVYGIDGSEKMLDICRKKSLADEIQLCDLEKEKINFPDNYFDFIISNGVLYLISNLDNFFSESLRLLKPGGYLAFNFEELYDGLQEEYRNFSNCIISKKAKEVTGLTAFKYSRGLLLKHLPPDSMDLMEVARYFAYQSPTTKEDVYFTLLIFQKSEG